MSVYTWLVIVFLISVNALYVAAEFAAVAARRSRVRQLAEDGNALAASLLPILQDARKLDRYIAACQIGITLSSLVLGAYGQATLAVYLVPLLQGLGGLQEVVAQSTASLVVLVGLTATQVVLGELVPKSLALQFPTPFALYTFIPMRGSIWLFSWFIALLNGSGIAILRLLGIPEASHRHIHSPEEIDLLIAESADGGLMEPDEQRRLRRALRLGVRPVHQLMVPRRYLSAVSIDTPVNEVLRVVAQGPYTRLPVYEESIDNIVGMLHAKDVAARYAEQGRLHSLKEVMRPMTFVPKGITADLLLIRLRETHSQQAVVVDEYGGVDGLVTLEDVLTDVLGEIDEGGDWAKIGQPEPERLSDGRVRLPGLMRLDEAEEWIGAFWQGEADTIGGHIMAVLGHLPVPGERARIDAVDVEIEAVKNRAVWSVLAAPVRPVGGDDG